MRFINSIVLLLPGLKLSNMQKLKVNCSAIIDRCNKWLNDCRIHNRTEQYINTNFAAMFLHLCKGNNKLAFLSSYESRLLQNRGLRYRIKDYQLLNIEFLSPWNSEDYFKKIEEINKIFLINLPASINVEPVKMESHEFRRKRTTSSLIWRRRFLPVSERIFLAIDQTKDNIKSTQHSVDYQMRKLKNFSFK